MGMDAGEDPRDGRLLWEHRTSLGRQLEHGYGTAGWGFNKHLLSLCGPRCCVNLQPQEWPCLEIPVGCAHLCL